MYGDYRATGVTITRHPTAFGDGCYLHINVRFRDDDDEEKLWISNGFESERSAYACAAVIMSERARYAELRGN